MLVETMLRQAQSNVADTVLLAEGIHTELAMQREQLLSSKRRVGTVDGLIIDSRRVLRRMQKVRWQYVVAGVALAAFVALLLYVFVKSSY